ncbi:MAG: TolC family protein [Fibrobacterota bacterium]
MKRIIIMLIIPAFFLRIYGQAYTVDDLIAHAFSHSEDLRLLRQEREQIDYQEREHRASGLPQINGSVAYMHVPKSYNPYDFDMDMGNMDGSIADQLGNPAEVFLQDPDYDATPGDILAYKNVQGVAQALDGMIDGLSSFDLSPRKNTLNWEVKLEQVIFAQGKIKTAVEIAQIAYDNIDAQVEAEKFSIARDVRQMFNAYLVARDNYDVQTQGRDLSRRIHEIARLRLDAGQGTELDTLNSKYALKESESSVREAAKNMRLAKKKLLTRVSLDADSDDVSLEGSLKKQDIPCDFSEARERLREANRNLKSLNILADLRDKQVSMSRTDFLPSLGAFASTGQTSQYNSTEDIDFGWNVEVGMGVEIPIFHGGQRLHRLEQARVDRRMVTTRYEKTERQLMLALEAAYESYELAREELEEAKEMVHLANKSVSVSEAAYEVGQISQLELDRTHQQHRMSRLSENAALLELNDAVIQIKDLIGESSLIQF